MLPLHMGALGVASILGILVAWALASALLTWVWNITLPELFNVKQIRFWQAFRLTIIGALLFGGGLALH